MNDAPLAEFFLKHPIGQLLENLVKELDLIDSLIKKIKTNAKIQMRISEYSVKHGRWHRPLGEPKNTATLYWDSSEVRLHSYWLLYAESIDDVIAPLTEIMPEKMEVLVDGKWKDFHRWVLDTWDSISDESKEASRKLDKVYFGWL